MVNTICFNVRIFATLMVVSLYGIGDRSAAYSPQPGPISTSVERAADGYLIRYRDPDFDNEWREYFLSDAGRLSITVSSTIKPYTSGLWSYEYTIKNAVDSRQRLVSWSMQVAHGTEVMFPPFGWRGSIERPGLSLLTWSSDTENAVEPGATTVGWVIVSDQLPAARSATFRGAHPAALDMVDLPPAVRRRITQLDAGNSSRSDIIGPWIPTHQFNEQRTPLEPQTILRDALGRYRSPLQNASERERGPFGSGNPNERDSATIDDLTLELLERAQAALSDSNPTAAREPLRQGARLLQTRGKNEWLTTLRTSLAIVVAHVLDRID